MSEEKRTEISELGEFGLIEKIKWLGILRIQLIEHCLRVKRPNFEATFGYRLGGEK